MSRTTRPGECRTIVKALSVAYGQPVTAEPDPPTWLPPTTRRWPNPDTGPWAITLHWQVVAGRPEAVAVDIASALPPGEQTRRYGTPDLLPADGQPLRTGTLRGLNLATILAEERVRAAAVLRERGQRPTPPDTAPVEGMRDATRRQLEQAAAVYRQAIADGRDDPNRAVAEHLGISQAAAGKRVQRARAAGMLPPTTPGVSAG